MKKIKKMLKVYKYINFKSVLCDIKRNFKYISQ